MDSKGPQAGIHPAPREFNDTQLQEDAILRYFHYRHLPPLLQEVSAPFCGLAHMVVTNLPRNPERSVALRKLLEAKDAAVRANVPATAHKETFLDRMHKERADLLGRIEKLNVFIDTLPFFSLPQVQQDLMRQQCAAMQTYFDALNHRLKLLEDDEPEHVRRQHDQAEDARKSIAATSASCTCGESKAPCPVHEPEPVHTGAHHTDPPRFDA